MKLKAFIYTSIQEEIDHTPKQDMLIKIIGDWNTKVKNKVESTVIGKFGLGVTNKADQLVDFCEANNLFHHEHLLQTAKEMAVHMDITRWQYRNPVGYVIGSRRWRSWILPAKTRTGADCGSDHKLLKTNNRVKLKKSSKRNIMYVTFLMDSKSTKKHIFTVKPN